MIWLPGVLSQGGKKFFWEKYSVVKVEIETGTGTAPGDTNICRPAKNYIIDGNVFRLQDYRIGVFRQDLEIGDCVISFAVAQRDAVSGTTLCKVTKNDGTIYYTKYGLTDSKGSLVGTVSSGNANAFPDNGISGGYWYVRIESGDEPDTPPGVNYVDYIQSTGTQFLDTKYVPNANTRVEMTFQLTNPDNTNQAIFGTAGQFSFRWYGASNYFRTNGSNNVNFSTSIDKNAKHTVVKTATKTTIDGTYSVNTTAGNVSLSLYLFAQHGTSGMQNPAKLKCWECKIYESDVLLHNYRPCLDPDGVACLYDEVNKEYVYNSGTGEFVTGVVSGGVNYVDYIQSDGAQYIDTGFKPNNKTRVTMDFYMNDGVESSARYIFGARSDNGSLRYDFLWSGTAEAYTSLFYNGSTSQGYILNGVSAAGRHFVDKNKRVTTLDNASVTSTNDYSFTAAYSMYVGATNQAGTALAGLPGRIYSCQIYDNNVLIRDYRPCLDPDGVPCYYDEVNAEYVYNAGSGTFSYGLAA